MEDQRPLPSAAENGANSPGPAPPEAKPPSARNAENKPACYANAVLLRHECVEAFTIHRESYYQRFLPTTPPEADLVDQMIAATWRLRRFTALESAAIDHTMDAQRAILDATYSQLDTETRTHLAFDQLQVDSGAMAVYQRAQAAQIRQYDRALRNLQTLQGPKLKERT